MGIRIWVIFKKIALLSSVGEVPQLPSLRYQRFQFRVSIQTNNTAKDDCEIGFVDGGGNHCNDHNYRKRLWNQSLEHNRQLAAEKTIPTLLLAESVRKAILSWRAAECREMAKICAISKLIGLTENGEIPGPRKLNRNITGD